MISQQILSRVAEADLNGTVGVLFDEDTKRNKEYFGDFCSHYMSDFIFGDAFAGYGFGDSKKFTPIQAADLLAYGTLHLVQERHFPEPIGKPDFPVVPAFWNMLLKLAESRSTSPNGTLFTLVELKNLVQKVKNRERLPRKGDVPFKRTKSLMRAVRRSDLNV
jgi:hypothetical protein